MEVITKEFLENAGFENNHPERVLQKFYLSHKKGDNYEFHIMVEQQYLPSTSNLCWNVDCWRTSEGGVAISRRASLHGILFVDELKKIIELCEIDVKI